MSALYTAEATAQGGREGNVKTSDNSLELKLVIPKELGGPGGAGTNPEQLFAAGYAACFESALRLVARSKKIPVDGVSVTAKVSLLKAGQAYGLAVALTGRFPGLSEEDARALMGEAHKVCPYSAATRGNVEVDLHVAV